MKLKDQLLRHWVGGAVVTLLTVAVGLSLQDGYYSRKLRHLSYDLFLVAHRPAPVNEVALVYMDERSFVELHQPRIGIWDRALHAELIQRVTAAGAKAVVFDIVFLGPSGSPASDEALSTSIRTNGNVILAADANRKTEVGNTAISITVTPPYEPFLNSAKDIGWDELDVDRDQIARRHLHLTQAAIPSMTWAAAAAYGAPITQKDENRGIQRWINYYGKADSLPHISYSEVL